MCGHSSFCRKSHHAWNLKNAPVPILVHLGLLGNSMPSQVTSFLKTYHLKYICYLPLRRNSFSLSSNCFSFSSRRLLRSGSAFSSCTALSISLTSVTSVLTGLYGLTKMSATLGGYDDSLAYSSNFFIVLS